MSRSRRDRHSVMVRVRSVAQAVQRVVGETGGHEMDEAVVSLVRHHDHGRRRSHGLGRSDQGRLGHVGHAVVSGQSIGDLLEQLELLGRRSGRRLGVTELGRLGDEHDHAHRHPGRAVEPVERRGERPVGGGISEGSPGFDVENGDPRGEGLAQRSGHEFAVGRWQYLVDALADGLRRLLFVEGGQALTDEDEPQVGVEDGHAEGTAVDEGVDGGGDIGMGPGGTHHQGAGGGNLIG
jgi:hypothetical protein